MSPPPLVFSANLSCIHWLYTSQRSSCNRSSSERIAVTDSAPSGVSISSLAPVCGSSISDGSSLSYIRLYCLMVPTSISNGVVVRAFQSTSIGLHLPSVGEQRVPIKGAPPGSCPAIAFSQDLCPPHTCFSRLFTGWLHLGHSSNISHISSNLTSPPTPTSCSPMMTTSGTQGAPFTMLRRFSQPGSRTSKPY